MRKVCELLVVVLLMMSLFPNVSLGMMVDRQHANVAGSVSSSVTLSSQPMFTEKDGFIQVSMVGATTSLSERNKPVLPIVVRTFEVPFCSKDITVECIPRIISSMDLRSQIVPACIASLSKPSGGMPYLMDVSVYENRACYPGVWYTYDLGSGRNNTGQEVTFVKVICYPVQYSPLGHELRYALGFDITVRYILPAKQAKLLSTYDLVVIAPQAFQTTLQPLIDHKYTKGVKTLFKTTEDIFSQYIGADPPEQVKLFIKDAYDTWGIRYVLLVGGLKSHVNAHDKDTSSAGYSAWWVPVRYANIILYDEGYFPSVICDLYYGCLYNATGGFDSWDSNHDGIYAAMGDPGVANDTFDLYPEVAVGRLPVTTTRELSIVVNKIITYENSGPEEKPWYNTFIGVAGKVIEEFQGKPDGEYLADLAYNETKNAIPDLRHVQAYASNRGTGRLVPVPRDIIKAISDGAGFVDFEGHGSIYEWGCIWANKDGSHRRDYTPLISIYHFFWLSNGEALPVVTSIACWNGLFNWSMFRKNTSWGGLFAYSCFCWGLVLKNQGGAIASIGNTGSGWMNDTGDPVNFGPELNINFYYEIGNGSIILGQAHSGAIQKFLATEHIGLYGAYCIAIWQLFGDPSLRLGGYSS